MEAVGEFGDPEIGGVDMGSFDGEGNRGNGRSGEGRGEKQAQKGEGAKRHKWKPGLGFAMSVRGENEKRAEKGQTVVFGWRFPVAGLLGGFCFWGRLE